MKRIIQFIQAAIHTFADASSGNYRSNNKALLEIRRRIFSDKRHRFRDGRISLMNDKKKVSSDIHKAFNMIKRSDALRKPNNYNPPY